MTTFRTQLKLKDAITENDVWETIKKWRLQSPHSSDNIKDEVESYTEAPPDLSFADADITIESKKIKTEALIYWGFHLTEQEKNKTWNTYIVFSRIKNNNYLTFETTVDGTVAKNIGRNKPQYFSRFITPLIDISLTGIPAKPISADTSTQITQSLINILNGKQKVELPIVYISKTKSQTYLLDPEKLAAKLHCMAFVFTEPSTDFSYQLKEQTNSSNVFDGAIGIYWGNKERFYFHPAERPTIESVYLKVAELTALKPFSQGTSWFDMQQLETVQEQKKLEIEYEKLSDSSTLQIKNLQAQIQEKMKEIHLLNNQLLEKEKELDTFMAAFDSENKKLREENGSLTEKNIALTASFSDKQEHISSIAIAVPCTEKELFPDEIKDFLKGIFFTVINKEPYEENTRKAHVLESIKPRITDWNFYHSSSAKRYEDCETEWEKNISKKGTDIVTLLEKHGFTDRSATRGEHCKVIFYGDDRYMGTISKTPSDARGKKNTIKDTKKNCFLIPYKHD